MEQLNMFENEEFFMNIVNQMVLAARMEQKAQEDFTRAENRLKMQQRHRIATEDRCKNELKTYCEQKGIPFDEQQFN